MTSAAPGSPGATSPAPTVSPLATRFRGYLPVVVDVETGGFDWNRCALLEIAVQPIDIDENGLLFPGDTTNAHVVPAPGLHIDPKSLEITGIKLDHPFRLAKEERPARSLRAEPGVTCLEGGVIELGDSAVNGG